jgi:hypothetical protein
MSVVQFTLRIKLLMPNNLFIRMNSVRLVNYESYQRRSLAPVRYVAQAALTISVTYLVGLDLSTGFRSL